MVQDKGASRPENVRERILQEATRQFATNGYEGTKLQSIADTVGIRKPSLLYHFHSKERLHGEVIAALLGHWKEEIPRLLLAATDERDRLASIVKALLRFFQEDPNRARLVMREVLDHPGRVAAAVREHLTPWMRLITDYLRMDQTTGLVKPEVDPEAFISHIVLMVLAMLVAQQVTCELVDAGEGFPERLSRELVRISRDALFAGRSGTREPSQGPAGADDQSERVPGTRRNRP